MSLAVVQCPACRGASRVAVEALGHMVSCPRCQVPFVAEEDIPVVHPRARAPAPRPAPAVPVAPVRRRPLANEPERPPLPAAPVSVVPDPEHDPHTRPVAGLPVSVLVGLALLPFGIPLLWRVTPFLTGQEAALSMVVPVALAVAASALCLGVVYTIDWTATTRIKGVLMLVCLSYLSAAGLFFLKKDLMDRLRAWGGDANQWGVVALRGANCRVQMPVPAMPTDGEKSPLDGLVRMADSRRATLVSDAPDGARYEYRFAVSDENAVGPRPDDEWFDRVGEKLRAAVGAPPLGQPDRLAHQERPDAPGRQWKFELGDSGIVRVVQVYAIGGRVYYLSAEGPKLRPDDEYAQPFFGTFLVETK